MSNDPAPASPRPPVYANLEEGAARQEAQDLLSIYDFRMYGEGLTAGAHTAPRSVPENTVVFAPGATGAGVDHAPAGPSNAGVTPTPRDAPDTRPNHYTWSDGAPGGTHYLKTTPLQAATDQCWESSGAAAGMAATNAPYMRVWQQHQQHLMSPSAATPAVPTGRYPTAAQAQLTKPPNLGSAQPALHSRSAAKMSLLQRIKQAPGTALHWLQVQVLAGWAAAHRAVVHLLMMLGRLLVLLVMLMLGAVLGPWYKANRAFKKAAARRLAQGWDRPFDADAVKQQLGALPIWLEGAAGGQLDKLTWLNNLIAEVWPVMDPYVCALTRTTVEPMLDQYKPPFIAKLGFQRMTLGDTPVQIEAVRLIGDTAGSARHKAGRGRAVSGGGRDHQQEEPSAASGGEGGAATQPAKQATSSTPDAQQVPQDSSSSSSNKGTPDAEQLPHTLAERVEFEVDFVWQGQPNVAFFVEVALLGPYTRLVPRVSNLTVRGTLRLALAPLLPVIPGFGALLVSFTQTPMVKFTLDFGPALGGKFTARPVATFLDPFIRDTLANLLVWPQRFVVPLLPPEVTGSLDELQLRSRGVLKVEVIRAEGLVKRSKLHSVDPRVELWTQATNKVCTSSKARTRHPRWHAESFQLLIQEPNSQNLRVVVEDMEMFNLKELLQVNVLKGARSLLSNAVPIGRAKLPLRKVCSHPGERQEVWLDLSGDEWEEDLGVTAGDRGRVQLALTYTTFATDQPGPEQAMSCRGVLFVDVRCCRDLISGDWQGHSSDPYVQVQVGSQVQRTAVVSKSLNPVFNSYHEFFNVQTHDVIRIQVRDKDFLKPDDSLGQVVLPVKELVAWVGPSGVRGVQQGWWQLGSVEHGAIELKLQYKAYSNY